MESPVLETEQLPDNVEDFFFFFFFLKGQTYSIDKIVYYTIYGDAINRKVFSIDINSYSSLYQFKTLLLMRIVTISFMVWILINIFIRMRGKYER